MSLNNAAGEAFLEQVPSEAGRLLTGYEPRPRRDLGDGVQGFSTLSTSGHTVTLVLHFGVNGIAPPPEGRPSRDCHPTTQTPRGQSDSSLRAGHLPEAHRGPQPTSWDVPMQSKLMH